VTSFSFSWENAEVKRREDAATGARILANARRLGREIPTDWFLQKEHT